MDKKNLQVYVRMWTGPQSALFWFRLHCNVVFCILCAKPLPALVALLLQYWLSPAVDQV